MELLTPELEQQLRNSDPKAMRPIVKFFNPVGAGTWLICHMDKDGDTLWGYCCLGMGCVEYGAVSLAELRSLRLMGGLGIERDLYIDLTRCPPNRELLALEDLRLMELLPIAK